MRAIKADGLYISAHNKKLNLRNFKKDLEVIGGAHNFKEIKQKKFQGCSEILLSRLFETSYKYKKGFMGVVKFNLFSKLIGTSLSPLGGINFKNLNKLKNVNCENIALSSLIIDKAHQAQKVLK